MKAKELTRIIRDRAAGRLPVLLGRLPEGVGRRLCAGLGTLSYTMIGRDRRLAHSNLKRVFPRLPDSQIRRFAIQVFESLGRSIYTFVAYPNFSRAKKETLVETKGLRHLRRALEQGRGVVLVTGHISCWELIGAELCRLGFPLRAVAQPIREERLERRLSAHRRRLGFTTLSNNDPRAAVRHLKQNGVLGLLVDQRIKNGRTVTVRLLGQDTELTPAPVRLAQTTGAVMITAGLRQTDNGTFVLSIDPPVAVGEVQPTMQALAGRLDRYILAAPEQWMWIHPRWELLPETGTSLFPRRKLVPASLLTLLTLVLAVFVAGCSDIGDTTGAEPDPDRPDRSMTDFEITETNTGRRAWRLHAEKADQFFEEKQTRLTGVRLVFFEEDGTVRSTMTSDHGIILDSSREMTAAGNVRVISSAGDTLDTEKLHYLEGKGKIWGPGFVRLAQQDRVLTGEEFHSNPDLTNYEIKRDVHMISRSLPKEIEDDS